MVVVPAENIQFGVFIPECFKNISFYLYAKERAGEYHVRSRRNG